MKVLHIGQMIGGLDVYVRNSIEYSTGNIEYVVVHGKNDKSKPVYKKVNNERIKVKEYFTLLQRDINLIRDLITLFQLLVIIHNERPDIIHCHSAKGGVLGRLCGFFYGIPTLYTPHGFSFLSTPSRIISYCYKMIEKITRLNSYLLACGESEKELGTKEIGYKDTNALCWHNCVSGVFRSDGRAEKSNNQIVSIGRPSYQKNSLFLVDVVNEVHKTMPNLKFLLLGVGYYSPDLQAMKDKIASYSLENAFQLVDWVNHDEALKITSDSLFFLTVSRYEGLPLSVLEAMSLGKAIVATNVVGNVDCVIDGVNGFLSRCDDVQKMAEAIILMASDEDKRTAMEQNSRRLFEEGFMIEKRILLLENIYKNLANK